MVTLRDLKIAAAVAHATLQEAVNVFVHSASNVIPLHKNVERVLDCFRITIIPDVGNVFQVYGGGS